MANFAREQNVLRYSKRLKSENDPATRKMLSKLLLDEENKFAATAEQLDQTDRRIANCKAYITRQYSLIDELNVGGHEIAPAERFLRNLMELHDLFVRRRQVSTATLDRRAL